MKVSYDLGFWGFIKKAPSYEQVVLFNSLVETYMYYLAFFDFFKTNMNFTRHLYLP